LAWLGASIAAIQGIRRYILGGATSVALDPALPLPVRLEMLKSRAQLRARASGAPRAFRRALAASADILEELPALLVTTGVLTGASVGKRGEPLREFRKLGQATALLFTAGRMHINMDGGEDSSMQLLAGDFLYAEGQWMFAELGSLPLIKFTAKMIRSFSDGVSEGGPASNEHAAALTDEVGYRSAVSTAYLRTGAFFAATTSGAAWLSNASPKTVEALHRYGADLGCALHFAQYPNALSQDCAVWLARAAIEALHGLDESPAVRAMRRLAYRVERSCGTALRRMLRQRGFIRGLNFAAFQKLQDQIDSYCCFQGPAPSAEPITGGLGFTRDAAAERQLRELISEGLGDEIIPTNGEFSWPEEGPKAAMETAFRCIGRELLGVNKMLDGVDIAGPACSELVRSEVLNLFAAGGKRLRPALVLLVAHALQAPQDKLQQVISLAVSVEVLHGASLVHDDILDGADSRRGKQTSHVRVGEWAAAFAGDFLFGSSSCMLADLDNMPTITLFAKVIADFGKGELVQAGRKFETDDYSLMAYLEKSFYKTASLVAASCEAAAVISGAGASSKVARASYLFGLYVGLGFQVIDDLLDFTSSSEELGKPALADIKEGNYSAPVLYALQDETSALDDDSRMELMSVLRSRLAKEEDLDRVLELVHQSGGLEKAKSLSRRFIDLAIQELNELPEGEARDGLRTFAEFVLVRSS